MISRRQLFVSGGAAAATLILDDPAFGILDTNAFASTLALDYGRLDGNVLANPTLTGFEAQDWATGNVMWDAPYACQPSIVAMPNGDLVSAMTVGTAPEGDINQHTVILCSTDHGDTWAQTAVIEPADGPEASWGMMWTDPASGRLYVFYTYNVDNIREGRTDCIGVVAYRSSVDAVNWTDRRYLRWPPSAIDLRNPWQGVNRYSWLSGQPVTRNGAGYFGLSKMGSNAISIFSDTEAFIVKVWETAPGELDYTISSPIRSTDAVNEEPSPIVYDDGLISVVFRTNVGQLGEAWSTDDGATWTFDWSRDVEGDIVPQPRGNAAQFQLPDGRIFLWGHNNNIFGPPGDTSVLPSRHPVYYRIGERVGQRIVWGPPRLLLWDKSTLPQLSYPSAIVDGDTFLVAASEKKTAKTFRFPLPA